MASKINYKANVWDIFLKENDSLNNLFQELEKLHNAVSSTNNCSEFLLEDFSDQEVKDVIHLCQETFGFKDQISKHILKVRKTTFYKNIQRSD